MTKLKVVATACLLTYVIWYLMPHIEYRWMTEDAIVLTSYSGLESVLELTTWIPWTLFGVTILMYTGVIVFGRRFRIPFFIYFALMLFLLTPLTGIVVESSASIALRDLGNVLLGVTIAALFLEPEPKSSTSTKSRKSCGAASAA